MAAPATYEEWLRLQGKSVPERFKSDKPKEKPGPKPGSKHKKGRGRGRDKVVREVRENHVLGGSRWCYSRGCGHPDCYQAEADYYAARKQQGYNKHRGGWGDRERPPTPEPDNVERWFNKVVRGCASL